MGNLYLQRYAWPEALYHDKPRDDLGLIITIPAFDENRLELAIGSIYQCKLPKCAVEIHILINYPENPDEYYVKGCKEMKDRLLKQFPEKSHLKLYIHDMGLPRKHAGVGLARKILMDEAVRRFERIQKDDGIIVGFDADCSCSTNYLQAIYSFFQVNRKAEGASIYFEHPENCLENSEEVVHAALDYELHLRCYIDALRWAGVPHSFQTIGSAMAVRSRAYQKQGGMNRRKAGEDFYFLHRIIREGNYGDITDTKVIPSPRPSDRVPFGTGKAVINRLSSGHQLTYNPKSYYLLKEFINLIEDKIDTSKNVNLTELPVKARGFFKYLNFEEALSNIQRQSSTESRYRKHFYQWFDGFKVMKFLHYLRDEGYEDTPIKESSEALSKLLGRENDQRELLRWYRDYDQNNPKYLQF